MLQVIEQALHILLKSTDIQSHKSKSSSVFLTKRTSNWLQNNKKKRMKRKYL